MVRAAPDPVGIIEVAYALELDTDRWVKEALDRALPAMRALPGYTGTVAWIYDHRRLEAQQVHGFCSADVDEQLHEATYALNQLPRQGVIEDAHERSFGMFLPFASAADLMGPLFESWWQPYFARELGRASPADFVAMNAIRDENVGLMIGAFVDQRRAIEPRTYALWSRLAAHLSAGLRLRARCPNAGDLTEDADAILTPRGKVEHATGRAASTTAMQELGEAAKAIDRARGALRHRDSEEAVEVWRALVDGRWSLVESFVSDGRRYLIAKRNDATLSEEGPLSERQRQVLFFACQGHSNKLIAYELGLSPESVSTHLNRAAKRLGARSRAELIRRYHRLVR